MATGPAQTQNNAEEKVLDPYSCLSLKGPKYARETDEVYLANQGGTSLSDNFQHFFNLEVVWFNNNRLTHLHNLEPCFRIREMYISNNRLVSLNFLKSFKFLRTLLASNNQIRNLDKQLGLLSRLSFLKKLDLFDNSIADEPDYRLRMAYHVPQVEILDRLGVTMEQRQRAEEVVPNMDKVSSSKPVRAPKKAYTFTKLESDCFRTAKLIRDERTRVEDDVLRKQTFARSASDLSPATMPRCQHLRENTLRWSHPSHIVNAERHNPTAWEKQWNTGNHESMQVQIEQLAAKDELNKEDVLNLARTLAEDGLEDFGRALSSPAVFAPVPLTPRSESKTNFKTRRRVEPPEASPDKKKAHPLEALTADPDATMPTKEVVAFLLSQAWHRLDDEALSRQIGEHNSHARFATLRATFGVQDVKYGEDGDDQVFFKCRDKVSRLEGLRTRKSEVGLKYIPPAAILRKSRSDVFSQSFLKPVHGVDEATGRSFIAVAQGAKSTRICG